MTFNSREYDWSDLSLVLAGRLLTGVRAVKYTVKQEKEVLYAKGRHGHSIQRGNVSVEGEITLLQSEVEALIVAGKGNILDLNLNAICSYGNPAKGEPLITDVIEALEFTELSKELKQGDKNMEVTLPFIALRLRNAV